MNNNEKRNTSKPEPFYAPYSDVPITNEEIEKRKRKYYRLKVIGVDPNIIIDDENIESENPYIVEAMIIINRDKDVPPELIEKVKKYDLDHNIRRVFI